MAHPSPQPRTAGAGPVGDIRYRVARILVGRGLAGELVRVEGRTGQVEVYCGDYRVRCLSAAELRPETTL